MLGNLHVCWEERVTVFFVLMPGVVTQPRCHACPSSYTYSGLVPTVWCLVAGVCVLSQVWECLEPSPGSGTKWGQSGWSPSFSGELCVSLRETPLNHKMTQWALSGVVLTTAWAPRPINPVIMLSERQRRPGWSEESNSHRMNGFIEKEGMGGQSGREDSPGVGGRGPTPGTLRASALCIWWGSPRLCPSPWVFRAAEPVTPLMEGGVQVLVKIAMGICLLASSPGSAVHEVSSLGQRFCHIWLSVSLWFCPSSLGSS